MSEALTYDDVLLVPSYNHWESRKVVDTNITDRSGLLSLEIPVMTSNMDTITEVDMENLSGAKEVSGCSIVSCQLKKREDAWSMQLACFCICWMFRRGSPTGRSSTGCKCRIFLHQCRPYPSEICRSYPEKST